MKHKAGAGQTIVRVIMLAGLAVGGFAAYQKFGKAQDLSIVSGKVAGIAAKYSIDTNGILNTANKKLVESQPIISEKSSGVLGDTTSNISDSAKQIVQETATKIGDQIKDLPKQEAAKITRQVCDQIIADLEK